GAEAQPAIPALAEALRDADREVRIQAIDALREIVHVPPNGELDASGNRVLQSFVTALRDPDAEVRRAGQLGLIRLRKLAAPALGELLKDPDAAVRQQALEVGKKLGPDARVIVPALVAALRDADKGVRDGSGWALAEIDPELKEALPALQRALAGPPPAKGVVRLRTTNLGYLTSAELIDAAAGTSGVAVKDLLQELARRRGQNVLVTLLLATTRNDSETRQLGHRLVFEYLSQKPDEGQEEDAGRKLGLVKRLLEEGRSDVAQKRLQELLAAYPRTRAGEEVRDLLARAK